MRATRQAWPETISFLREHLTGSGGMGMGMGMDEGQGMHSPAPAPLIQEVLADLEGTSSKLIALAGALSQEQLGWRPMEGVRSASEVYMHVAATNYMLPRSLGEDFPEGVDWRNLESITSKGEVVANLRASFDYVEGILKGMSPGDLETPTRLFGRDTTRRRVVLQILTHAHEHLGQSIAYARANRVAPPWSRGGM